MEELSSTVPLLSHRWGIWLLIGLELVLAFAVFALGTRTTLLRDSGPESQPVTSRPYSLAKTQLAFWIVVVIGSFLYIYFAHGLTAGVLNNTALMLLGISTGTAALSGVARPVTTPVVPAAAPLPAAVPAGAAPAPVPLFPAVAPAVPVDRKPPAQHVNFLDDLLSDNEGMNVHRLQMVIWTVVFGFIFIREVLGTGKFPLFDDQAYILMGISSATYVWFKRTEK